MQVNQPAAPERHLTDLERAREAARMERARTGQLRPRTLHALCEQGARLIPCTYCGQKPGRACSDTWGLDGYHLRRFVGAIGRGLMTVGELPTVLAGVDVFTLATVIRDGAR